MARGKKTAPPPAKTQVVVDVSKTIRATYANADARFARVSPDTAMALDYALDRISEIEAENPIHKFREPPGNIRERIFHATFDAQRALMTVRCGESVLIRKEVE
jgi:hypothetical protein